MTNTVAILGSPGTLYGNPTNAIVSTPYSFQYAASQTECSAKAVFTNYTTANTWPPGLVFDAATCTLSGKPTQSGTYTVIVTNKDSGNYVQNTIYVTSS